MSAVKADAAFELVEPLPDFATDRDAQRLRIRRREVLRQLRAALA
jgi:hypothetical protein